MQIRHHVEHFGSVSEMLRNRDRQRDWFKEKLFAEPKTRGEVLDIGCGKSLLPHLRELGDIAQRLDGVDPDPAVMSHPDLAKRWNSTFEAADIPEHSYELAYAYYVLEHLQSAEPFFDKLHRVLKPGGVFWAISPHATHPFCLLTRAVQSMGIKKLIARRADGINEYPAYYRANTSKTLARAAGDSGFASMDFHYLPYVHWDHYFPRGMRWAPHVYDRLIGSRFRTGMLLFAVRLGA